MRLLHTSPVYNVDPILDLGICVRYSLGEYRRCWFTSKSMRAWARNHVSKRHGCSLADICVVEVDVPAAWMHKHSRGVFFIDRDVPPAHIVSVTWGGRGYKGPAQ